MKGIILQVFQTRETFLNAHTSTATPSQKRIFESRVDETCRNLLRRLDKELNLPFVLAKGTVEINVNLLNQGHNASPIAEGLFKRISADFNTVEVTAECRQGRAICLEVSKRYPILVRIIDEFKTEMCNHMWYHKESLVTAHSLAVMQGPAQKILERIQDVKDIRMRSGSRERLQK